jgi:hypothetical protein
VSVGAFADPSVLGFQGEKSVTIDSTLVFSHPALEDPLHIRSGANSIRWSYELNTTSTPTVGGEVVQILSCFVGPITIQGEAYGRGTGPAEPRGLQAGWGRHTPVDEAAEIITWFLDYMHRAGALVGENQQRRNETAVRFAYPARGWDFWIQVTDIQGFDFSADQVTVPWAITAEVVSDAGLNYFEAATMSQFTEDLTSRAVLQRAISPDHEFDVNPFVNPELQGVGWGDLSSRLGDNFQSLIAAWAGGDFMHWGFNPFGDPGDIMTNDPYSLYHQLVGGEFIGTLPGETILDVGGRTFTGPASGSDTTGDVNTKQGIVCAVVQEFKAAGIPPEIAIADAMVESGLSPNSRNPDDGGPGVDGVGLWQTHYGGAGGTGAALKAASVTDRESPVIKNYPADQQIKDAVAWWKSTKSAYPGLLTSGDDADLAEFAYRAQHPADHSGYVQSVQTKLPAARALIKSTDCTGGAGSAGLDAKRKAMLTYIEAAEGNEPHWHYERGGPAGRSYFPDPKAASISTDCSGYTSCVYHAAGLSIPAQSDAQGAQGSLVLGNVLVGDLCIYPDHVTVVKKSGTQATCIVSSHGQESGPRAYVGANYRGDLQKIVRILGN